MIGSRAMPLAASMAAPVRWRGRRFASAVAKRLGVVGCGQLFGTPGAGSGKGQVGVCSGRSPGDSKTSVETVSCASLGGPSFGRPRTGWLGLWSPERSAGPVATHTHTGRELGRRESLATGMRVRAFRGVVGGGISAWCLGPRNARTCCTPSVFGDTIQVAKRDSHMRCMSQCIGVGRETVFLPRQCPVRRCVGGAAGYGARSQWTIRTCAEIGSGSRPTFSRLGMAIASTTRPSTDQRECGAGRTL